MDSKEREKRFKCGECSSAFMTTSELETHKSRVHFELRPFQCEHCDYSAKLKGALQVHYATHFPQTYKIQSCPKCPYKCVTHQTLLLHLRVHTKEKPFACNMCSYRASLRYSLIRHTRTHTGEKPFKCSLCNSTFSLSSNLKRHKLFVHNKVNVRLVPCSFAGCDRKFANKYGARQHVKYFHNKEKRFLCPYCQKVFYAKSECVSHIRHRHTNERPYKCSICEYAAATSSILKKHENNTHGDYKAVECVVCQKKYKNVLTLTKHQKYAHSSAKGSKESAPQWKCKEPGCTKEYKFRQSLKEHVNSFHLQQRPFKCLYCDHTTASSSNLNMHLKSHTKEKPYSCNTCKRFFISRSGLSKHKATTHSELGPFQCDKCNHSAKTKQILKQHQKIQEPKQTTFECKTCKEGRGSKKPTNYSCRAKPRSSFHTREMHLNERSFKSPLSFLRVNTKCLANPQTAPRYMKKFPTSDDCPPCFVRLVRKTELERDPLFNTGIMIYA